MHILSEAFLRKAEDIQKRLRADLDAIGLRGVPVRIVPNKVTLDDADLAARRPRFWMDALQVVVNCVDTPQGLVPLPGGSRLIAKHAMGAAFLALKSIGVFTKLEWSVLVREAVRRWRYLFSVDRSMPGASEEERNEAAIALAFAAFMERKRRGESGGDVAGDARDPLERGRGVLAAIRRAVLEGGQLDPEAIFEALSQGEFQDRLVRVARARIERERKLELKPEPRMEPAATPSLTPGF